MRRLTPQSAMLAIFLFALSAPSIAEPPQALLEAIQPRSLKSHVSFLASDLLEGRDTPSRGLDIAAEYIASRFRAIGLEPIGDDGFFQTATMSVAEPAPGDVHIVIRHGEAQWQLSGNEAFAISGTAKIDLKDQPVHWIEFDESAAEALADIAERSRPTVVLTSMQQMMTVPANERAAFAARYMAFIEAVEAADVTAVLALPASDAPARAPRRRPAPAEVSIFRIDGDSARSAAEHVQDHGPAEITFRYTPPAEKQVTVRNVVGLLEGNDPALADEYILVTAHYDHLGRGVPVGDDDIYNGANDNASGTAGVIDLAAAFMRTGIRPRRSILFLAVYGEERGLLGSRHYVQNPLVPLEQTIANINFEHLGRTDDVEGDTSGRIMPTGYGYSTAIEPFKAAADHSDFEIYHHAVNSDRFFRASDNAAFAAAGIPAHTFCVGFIFPEYHQPGDTWEKIDYENMTGALRVLAAGLLKLADQDERPQWNAAHRRTGPYFRAWQKLHGKEPVEASP